MLTLVSQTPFSALTVADMQTHVRDTSEANKDYIQSLLDAAVDYCERYLNMDLRVNSWKLVVSQFPIWAAYNWSDVYGNYVSIWPFISEFAVGRSLQRWQEIPIPRGPYHSLDSIQYYDASNVFTTLDPSQYTHDSPTFGAFRLEPVMYWPISFPRPDAVQINFTSGWTSNTLALPPPSLLHAIRLLVGTWFAARESMLYGPETIASYCNDTVDCLLDQYRPGMYS